MESPSTMANNIQTRIDAVGIQQMAPSATSAGLAYHQSIMTAFSTGIIESISGFTSYLGDPKVYTGMSVGDYISPMGSIAVNDGSQWIAPKAGIIRSLRCYCQSTGLGGTSKKLTLYVNGNPTALSVTGTLAVITLQTDLIHQIPVAAGDIVRLYIENVSGAGGFDSNGWSMEYVT